MKTLINKSAVKAYLLSLNPKKSRVGQTALDKVESAVRRACDELLNHHDNVTGNRKTIE